MPRATIRHLFLFAILVLLVLGLFAWSQRSPSPRAPRVVAMIQLTRVDAATAAGFKEGLAALGYREGRDVVYLSGGPAGDVARLDALIQDHLRRRPDLILVSSTPATLAVRRLTQGRHIPVVFAPVNDPLAAGIVADLKHPGGWITGVRLPTGEDLRLQWLVRMAPHVRRVFVPYSPADPSAQASLRRIAAVAPRLGLALRPWPVHDTAAILAAARQPPADVDAVFLPRDSSVESHIDAFAATALARRLPLCAPSLVQVRAGALFSYGFIHQDIGRQAARLADQIFQGVAPGDLPVEMAENFLSLNLLTARRIGLAIPDDVLNQTDHLLR